MNNKASDEGSLLKAYLTTSMDRAIPSHPRRTGFGIAKLASSVQPAQVVPPRPETLFPLTE